MNVHRKCGLRYAGHVEPDYRVAGTDVVSGAWLQRRIGLNARVLYDCYLSHRDGADGPAHQVDRRTREQKARKAGLKVWEVKKADALLARLGLVWTTGGATLNPQRQLGSSYELVPCGYGAVAQLRRKVVYYREVLGARLAGDPAGICYSVPAEARERLGGVRGWGGYRHGRRREEDGVDEGEAGRVKKVKRGRPPRSSGAANKASVLAVAFPSEKGPEIPGPASGGVLATAAPAQSPPSVPAVPTHGLGASLLPGQAGAREGLAQRLRAAGAPAFPVVDAAVVPPAPQLPEGLPDREGAERLAAGYRTAMSKLCPPARWTLARGDVRKSGAYPTLVAAAKMLAHHGIAPAAWAAWRQGWWAEKNGAGAAIPLRLCFSVESISAQYGWWEDPCRGGQRYVGPALRALLSRHQQMVAAVAAAPDDAAARAAVEAAFPPGAYERAVREAERAAQGEQAALDAQAARGDWLPEWRCP